MMTEQQQKFYDMGFRAVCFSAGHSWGQCTCKNEVPEEEGFEFEGTNIIDPSLDVTGCYFVEPTIYYGDTYISWKNRFTSIDYPGWEQVDFKAMTWKFDDGVNQVDYRKLKRVDANTWLITDDHGGWQIYGIKEETECLESFYQSFLCSSSAMLTGP